MQEKPKKVKLFYANGMLNSKHETKVSSDMAYMRLSQQYSSEKINGFSELDLMELSYEVLYNESGTKQNKIFVINELAEVIRHGSLDLIARVSDWLISQGKKGLTESEVAKLIARNLYDWIALKAMPGFGDAVSQNDYSRITQEALAHLESFIDGDLAIMKQQVKDAIDNDYVILIISHSQGNYYIKKLYDDYLSSLPEDHQIAYMSVGSPITLNFPHTQLRDVKDFVACPLEAMCTKSTDLNMSEIPPMVKRVVKNWWGKQLWSGKKWELEENRAIYHSFMTYILSTESKARFDEFFKESLENFDFSDSLEGEEIVRIELEKTDPRMKLYVREQFTGVDQSINYYVGENLDYVNQELDKVSFGYGNFTSTATKDTYSLTCDKLVNIGQANGQEYAEAILNGYVYSPYNDKKATLTMTSKLKGMSGERTSFVEAYIPRYDNTEWGDYAGANLGKVSSIPSYYIHSVLRSNQYVLKWSQYGIYEDENPDATPKPLP